MDSEIDTALRDEYTPKINSPKDPQTQVGNIRTKSKPPYENLFYKGTIKMTLIL
jgi:hypothetical protein|tara:strand:+ start:244 stop:405 length:162 start_codon:yes stop_codon:yes gene_type:complete